MEILHVTDELGDIIQKLPELLLASVHFLLERFQFVLRSQDGRNIIDVVGDFAVNLVLHHGLHLLLHFLRRSVYSLSFSYITSPSSSSSSSPSSSSSSSSSSYPRVLVPISSDLLLSLPLFYKCFYGDSDSDVERVRVEVRWR